MLKEIGEYGRFVGISGFRKVQIENAKAFLEVLHKSVPVEVEVQLFDAGLVATWEHLYFAALNALMAFRAGSNLSKSLAVESVLFASAQRQIMRAIDLMGVKAKIGDVAVLLFGENERVVEEALSSTARAVGVEPDESVLDLSMEKIMHVKETFDISDAELEATSAKNSLDGALVYAVVERVALLSTRL